MFRASHLLPFLFPNHLQEYLLHMLLQPRQSYIRAAKEFEVEGPDSWDAEGGEAGIAGSKKRRNISFWQRGLEAVGDMRSVSRVVFVLEGGK